MNDKTWKMYKVHFEASTIDEGIMEYDCLMSISINRTQAEIEQDSELPLYTIFGCDVDKMTAAKRTIEWLLKVSSLNLGSPKYRIKKIVYKGAC